MGAWIALAMLIFAGLTLVVRDDAGSLWGIAATDLAAGVAGIALLIFLVSPAMGRPEGRLGAMLRDFALWGAAALLLYTLYIARDELSRFAGQVFGTSSEQIMPGETLNPTSPLPLEGRSVRIRSSEGGQFLANTRVNGADVSMLVDTGATILVLSHEDARRIGLSLDNLDFSVPVKTAAGGAFAARLRLASVTVGPVGLRDVEALVAAPGALHVSLLGMSFLSRLRSYQIEGAFLTLRG